MSDGLSKGNGPAGSLQFEVGSDGFLRIKIPVSKEKTDEAVTMIEEVYTVAILNYYKMHNLNPTDVANTLRAVAEGIENYQINLVKDKYNGKPRQPRS